MLPIPNLDDRYFDRIVEEARRAIPKLFPQWTDENASDPGITLVELMSWMTELQQYYLNRITEKNERKFLKLLGIHLRAATLATAELTLTGLQEHRVLPQGTKLMAMDQMFETSRTLQIVPSKLDKIIVRTDVSASDYTSSNEHAHVAYYAFGPEAKSGSKLYLGFDRELPVDISITLSFQLFDGYPVSVGKAADGSAELISSGDVSWKYVGSEDGEGWIPVELIHDSTIKLSQSGQLVFRINQPMRSMLVHPANDKRRFWLCCTLEREGYELSPKIEQVHINAVKAVQRTTWSETVPFDSSGEAGIVCNRVAYLPYYGLNLVQVGEPDGVWRDWQAVADLSYCGPEDASYTLVKDPVRKTTEIRFGDGINGKIPPEGKRNIRLISYMPEFDADRWIGNSSGLPLQEFEVKLAQGCIVSTLLLQVGRREPGGSGFVWEDWHRVDDFDHSGSEDRHYMWDEAESRFRFGNNEEGWIPHASEPNNIRLIALQTGGGLRGNVKNGLITQLVTEDPDLAGLRVTNPTSASGGTEAESLEEAKHRVRRELNTPYRAVTGEDYENIARATPGLRVARVKAIPLYKPGMVEEQQAREAAQMTIVVVPYSEASQPQASEGFLRTVHRHLDEHRLLTTELHVIPAAYIKITVHAVVVMEPQMKDESRPILHELYNLLQPLDRSDGSKGWVFGRAVYKGDIYGAISRLKGVVYVQDLWIDSEGSGARKNASGDILIPPYGLVASGEHQVELISKTDI